MIAIISDVHANLQAFQAVVADATASGVREYWCLGDWVDYGANPNEVIELAKTLDITHGVGGNHDIALFSDVRASRTPHGLASHEFTKRALTAENAAWLEPFSRIRTIEAAPGLWLIHGTPADPYWGYLLPGGDMEIWAGELERLGARMLMVGHSHLQFALSLPAGRAIINPGSVGQPRNNCPLAQYMLYDGREFVPRQVPYDIVGAARKIRAAGLPEYLAERLHEGK